MKKYLYTILSTCLLSSFISCKKYADPAPYIQGDDSSTSVLKTRKVLFVNIDGLSGATLQSTNPENIMSLLQTSKYNLNTYEGDTSTQAAVWKTAVSAVSYSKHDIYDSSWVPKIDLGTDIETTPTYYPSFFEYLLMSAPQLQSYAVVDWDALYSNGGILYATSHNLVDNDKAVADSLLSKIENDNFALTVGEFNSYALENQANGYNSTSSLTALKTIDGYIGKLITAIKSRKNYSNEEWLVVLNSQYGGDGISVLEKGFRIMYNTNLKEESVQKNGYYTAYTASSSINKTAISQDDGGLYDPGTQDFTISFDMLLTAGSRIYPDILGKAGDINSPGWAIFQNASSFELDLNSTTNIRNKRFNSQKNISDGAWHNISFTLTGTQSNRKALVYVDGILDQTGTSPLDVSNMGAIASPYPMTLGVLYKDSDNGPNVAFHNIKIWRASLTADEISSAVKVSDMSMNPRVSDLIGYWACDDGHKTAFKNSLLGKPNFILGSSMSWALVTPAPSTYPISDSSSTSIDPDNTDIAPNIFNWLRTSVNSNWGWGDSWINNFEYEYGLTD